MKAIKYIRSLLKDLGGVLLDVLALLGALLLVSSIGFVVMNTIALAFYCSFTLGIVAFFIWVWIYFWLTFGIIINPFKYIISACKSIVKYFKNKCKSIDLEMNK